MAMSTMKSVVLSSRSILLLLPLGRRSNNAPVFVSSISTDSSSVAEKLLAAVHLRPGWFTAFLFWPFLFPNSSSSLFRTVSENHLAASQYSQFSLSPWLPYETQIDAVIMIVMHCKFSSSSSSAF
jgi:hypothetical protein